MKKQYIYVMPESFITDEDVPIRWRILGTLNGFWVGGKTFYATNEWLEEELKTSKRMIQYGLSELEKLGLITRNIQGMSRIILPGGVKPHCTPPCNAASQRGAMQLHHTSDSTSDNKKEVDESTSLPLKRIETDDFGGWIEKKSKIRAAKDTIDRSVVFRIRKNFTDMCDKNLGIKPVEDMKGYSAIVFAMKKGKLSEKQIYDLFDEWFGLNKRDDETISITRTLSARQIEGYKVRNNVK